MEDIIDISFAIALRAAGIKLKNFGKSKDSFNSPGHAKQREKNMQHNAQQARK